MKKAFLPRLLCLALAMLLPFSALASAQQTDSLQKAITISITPGEMIKQMPPVADLLDVLSIALHSLEAENAFGLSLLVDDSEAFSAAFHSDEQGLFVQSKEAHEKVIFFTWEDLQKTLEQAMAQSGADHATIEQFRQSFSMGLASSGLSAAEKPAGSPADGKAQLQDPAIRQTIINATGGDDSYLKFVEGLMERMVYTTGEFTGEDHDPANAKAELVLSQADIAAAMDTTFMKQQIQSQFSGYASYGLTPEQLDQKVEETIQEAKDEIAKMDIVMPVTVLYQDDELISFSMPITIKDKESDPPETISVSLDYRRLTTDGNVQHLFQLIGGFNDEGTGSAVGIVNCYANGSYDLDFVVNDADKVAFSLKGIYEDKDGQARGLVSALPIEGSELLLEFTSAKTETGSEIHISPYMRAPGADQLTLTADDMPLVTLNILIANEQPDGRFDALGAATLDSAVQPLLLPEEELNTFVGELTTNVTQAAFALLSKLPASVMELFMAGATTGVEEPVVVEDAPAVDDAAAPAVIEDAPATDE